MEGPSDKLPGFYQAGFQMGYGKYAMLFEVAFEICLETEG